MNDINGYNKAIGGNDSELDNEQTECKQIMYSAYA